MMEPKHPKAPSPEEEERELPTEVLEEAAAIARQYSRVLKALEKH